MYYPYLNVCCNRNLCLLNIFIYLIESKPMSRLITVIILVYNNFIYLPECLKSICTQSHTDIELIIGDDGSDNFSFSYFFDILSKYAKTNIKSICIYTNETNCGIVKNYMKALSYAKGEYIFYLAADDMLYDSEVLKDIHNQFISSKYLILTGYRKCFDSIGNQFLRPREEEVNILKYGSISKKHSRIKQKNIIAGANTPFHKSLGEVFQNIANYTHLEDWPRYLSLLEQNVDIGFIDRVLIYYRLGGLTSQSNNVLLQKDYELLFRQSMPLEIFREMDCFHFIIGIIDLSTDLQMVSILENILERSFDKVITWETTTSVTNLDNSIYIFVFTSRYYYSIANQLEKQGLIENENFSFINQEKMSYIVQNWKRNK